MSDLLTRLTRSDAVLSPCGQYRYELQRLFSWSASHALPFIMLNPSTADATNDDPTIRRCLGFARDRGFGGVIVANLFAYRATSPADMRAANDPIGPENDRHLGRLMNIAARAGTPVVAAWGTNGGFRGRDAQVRRMAREIRCNLVCLGTTADGHPRHPLYVKGTQPFEPLPPSQGEQR